MRLTRALSLTLISIAAVSLIASLSCSGQSKSSATPAAAAQTQTQRGEYLVTIAGCNDCHTPGLMYGAPDFDRRLSGSELGWPGPWGIAFARNLTPDPETGLGKWTDEQVITAFRTGQRPDGRQLAQIMPYADFASLTDEDAHAIVAYLRSLPPVSHKVPDPVAPGEKYAGSVITFPPPPAWDVPPPAAN
jgi:mono/diheme cytochrome c family protein